MKVLFLPQTGKLGPSSRYRVYQLLPWLQKFGIECEVSAAIDAELYRNLYLQCGQPSSRLAAFLETWKKRRADLAYVSDFDMVVVQKGVFPGLYSGFERKIAVRRPLVFDFDDAIWLPRVGGSQILRLLHRERSVQETLRCASAVIAGNDFLADYAKGFNSNVHMVPSAIDAAAYAHANNSTIVGWIGSSTTLPYLKPLQPVFKQLGITLRVIASGDPGELGFDVEFRPWRLETEMEELAQIGIGIAPLPDTPWERGKCGVKLLQYMACGIPAVASAVGVHTQIIRHGVNGLLAETESDWISGLRQLLADPVLRGRLGSAARETVAKHYDVRVAAGAVANVLEAITQTNGITGRLKRKSA